jgi:hypothetical protein
MPRHCTVCTHPQRLAIDQALVAGRSTYDLAAVYGLSPDALSRHFAAHVPADLKKARQERETEQALDIVKQLKAINMATLTVLNEARLAGQPDRVLRAADRVQRQLELQAKLLGELDERPQVNVLVSAEWVAVRTTLLRALERHPEARADAAIALLALEHGESTNGYQR